MHCGCWSHDPTLRSQARTASGDILTAVALQRRFLDEAKRFADLGGFERVVPRAAEILALWEETLRLLEARDFARLSSRIDWVLKLAVLQRVIDGRPNLAWDTPADQAPGPSVLEPRYGRGALLGVRARRTRRAGRVGRRNRKLRDRAAGRHAGLDEGDAAAIGRSRPRGRGELGLRAAPHGMATVEPAHRLAGEPACEHPVRDGAALRGGVRVRGVG